MSGKYVNLTKNDVYEKILSHIEKSEEELEEIQEHEAREESIDEDERDITEFKILFVKSDSGRFNPIDFPNHLIEIAEVNQWIRGLIEKWTIKVFETAEKDLYVLEAIERGYDLTHVFYLIGQGKYWQILTIENVLVVKQTILKILKHSPDLSLVWTPPKALEDISINNFGKDGFNGFIAKYRPLGRDKKVTIVLHGGDLGDLEKAREHFSTEPTLIKFAKKNSPTVFMTGTASFGKINIKAVLPNFREIFIQTLERIRKSYVQKDSEIFDVIPEYKIRTFFDNQDNPIAYAPENFSAIKLTIPERRRKRNLTEDIIIGRLRKNFLEEKSGQYFALEWNPGDFDIIDKESAGRIQVKYEDWAITIFSDIGAHPRLLRKICEDIIENVEPSCEPKSFHEVIL